MAEVILRGTTKKGKQRVKQHGPIWEVVKTKENVLFSDKDGPWLLLRAGNDLRWVHEAQDDNFTLQAR